MSRQAMPEAVGAEAPPFAPALVEGLLQLFGKAVRAHQLYLPNNPMYQRAIDQVRAGFEAVWRETAELSLLVMETEFRWEGIPVSQEATRAESLSWVFFKDGIRSLTFTPGFEGEELVRLLEMVQRVRRGGSDDDDLLTLLWEEDFVNLRYRFVDPDTALLPALEPAPSYGAERTVETGPAGAEAQRDPPPSIVRMQDFDSSIYFLDEEEMEYLRRSFEPEPVSELRRSTLAILFDTFELEPDETVRAEIVSILDQVVLHLLAVGDYRAVAYLVAETRAAAGRAPSLTPAQRGSLLAIPARLGAPQVLSQLLETLDQAREVPPAEELDALFEVLGEGALATVLAWVARLSAGPLREALERAATRLAATNVSELVRLVGAGDVAIALQATRRAGELRTPAAVSPLAHLLSGREPTLRLAAAQALAEIGSTGALQILERAVNDDDREVRITAVRVLGARGHRAALPLLEEAVRDRSLRDADLTEKMAYFEAYGLLAGQGGVDYLDGVLNGRGGLFARREDAETRACAALALGRIGSAGALDALRGASGDKEGGVRNAVAKALRGGAA
ncbi:MAG TPA: HEAT repeat domain-containing protein [Gemmatimonadaceae bacterium]|nr:HEAT repeat domain-containing protein [Gemmatimonadaceae bacterium]